MNQGFDHTHSPASIEVMSHRSPQGIAQLSAQLCRQFCSDESHQSLE